jgi:murein L,D-transpeptidase YcbB/YkuD
MKDVRQSLMVCVFLFLAGCSGIGTDNSESTALRAKLEQQDAGQAVWNIYNSRGFRPIWISGGKKRPNLQQFFQLVDDPKHGLHPERFGVDALRQEEHPDMLQFEIGVTSALTRYATALARKDVDVQQVLNQAIDSGSVHLLGDKLAPLHREYASLGAALQAAADVDRPKIELNMQRWRQMPDNFGERHVRINIPAYELQIREGDETPLKMKVVVGTNDTKTPLLSSEMKYVVFSPYWNIPKSILTKEILPKIRQNSNYLTKEDLEVVRVSGKRVDVINPNDIDWDEVDEQEIQLRQKPGKKNSLGLVKFIFPNEYDVYLHDTPADSLFERNARNLSHGCIRVEKPLELAEYVLREQPEWTTERIRMAMHAEEEKHVPLKTPLPVHILYFTAWVDEAGLLHLEKDIYGYDSEVDPSSS